jgi:hypothetical protein
MKHGFSVAIARLGSLAAGVPLAGLALLLAAIPVAAHHNFAAAYDASATITLTGVVTKVDWTNPHAYIYLDVKDESGKVVNWGMEGYPPDMLTRTGFTRYIVKVGDSITITGYRARENPTRAAARSIISDRCRCRRCRMRVGHSWRPCADTCHPELSALATRKNPLVRGNRS